MLDPDSWTLMWMPVAYLGLFGLIEAVVLMWRRRDRSELKHLKVRLQQISANQPALDAHKIKRGLYSVHPGRDRMLKRFGTLDSLELLLRASGQPYKVEQVLWAMGSGTGLMGLTAMLLEWDGWTAMVASLLAGLAPLLVLARARRLRLNKIEAQLPDALDLLAQAMRAGHAFSSALRTVGEEGPEPVCIEFRMASEEVNFGATVRESIVSMATRVDSVDMRFFAISILIQSETGGNLSALLQDLAKLIRERLKLRKVIRVLSAEGRLSGWILGGLPFLFGGVLYLTDPTYLAYFWSDPTGIFVLKIMGGMLLVGALWIRKITLIRI